MAVTIILSVFAVSMLVWLHAMHALNVGSKQRLALLEAINDKDPVVALSKLKAFSDVGFDPHIWRVTMFRDPWALYPPVLADEIKAVR